MRNGLIGLVGTMALASTMVTAGCGSSSGSGGTGGTSSSGGAVGTGGTSSSGGTGGNSSGGISVTTISDTTALNAADATQLCKDTYAYFGRAIPMATACKYKGLSIATSSSATSDSQFQQVCTDHETACLQVGSGVGSANDPGCSDLPSTCTATVAEYSACVSDEVVAFNQGVSDLPSCATAGSASISAVWLVMVPTPPASCDSLSNKCPDLSPPAPNN